MGYSSSVNVKPPPVEKTKLRVKKKKRKLKQRLKKRKKQKKPSYWDGRGVADVFSLIFSLMLIAGAIVLGLGVWYLIPTIVALCLLGIAIFSGSLLAIIDLATNGLLDINVGPIVFMIVMILFNLIAGLYFLIWGLMIATPMAWIVGIILLGLLLVLGGIYLIVFSNS